MSRKSRSAKAGADQAVGRSDGAVIALAIGFVGGLFPAPSATCLPVTIALRAG
jgi:hypothetical protein